MANVVLPTEHLLGVALVRVQLILDVACPVRNGRESKSASDFWEGCYFAVYFHVGIFLLYPPPFMTVRHFWLSDCGRVVTSAHLAFCVIEESDG